MERFKELSRKSHGTPRDILKRPEIPKNPAPVGRKIISERQKRMNAGLPLSDTSDSEVETNKREVKRAKVEEESVESLKEPVNESVKEALNETNEEKEEEATTVKEDTGASKTLSTENSDDSFFIKWDKNKARKKMNEKIRRTEELLGGEFNIFKDKAPPLVFSKTRPSLSSSDGDAKTEVAERDNSNNIEQREAAFHAVFVNRMEISPVENRGNEGEIMEENSVEILNRTTAGRNGVASPEFTNLTQGRRSNIHVYDSLSSDEMVTPDRRFSTPKRKNTEPLSILDVSIIPRSSFAKTSVIPSFSADPGTPRPLRDMPHFAKPTVASERKAPFKQPLRAPRGSRKTDSNEEKSPVLFSDDSVVRNENKELRVTIDLDSDSHDDKKHKHQTPVDKDSDSEESARGGKIEQKDFDSSLSDSQDNTINLSKEDVDSDSGSEISEKEKTPDSVEILDDEETDYGNIGVIPVRLSPRQYGDDEDEMENEDEVEHEDEVENIEEGENAMEEVDEEGEMNEDTGNERNDWHGGRDVADYGNFGASPVRLSPRQHGDDEEEMEDEDNVQISDEGEEEMEDPDSDPVISPRRGRSVNVSVDAVAAEEDEEEDSLPAVRVSRRRRFPVDRFDPDAVLREGQEYVLRPREIIRSQQDRGLRRSTRNRIATTRPWLSEHPIYDVTPGGDRVLKGVTRAVVNVKALIRAGTVNHKK